MMFKSFLKLTQPNYHTLTSLPFIISSPIAVLRQLLGQESSRSEGMVLKIKLNPHFVGMTQQDFNIESPLLFSIWAQYPTKYMQGQGNAKQKENKDTKNESTLHDLYSSEVKGLNLVLHQDNNMNEKARMNQEQFQPDAYDFLTFRNNQSPLQGTGRSVLSQQADYRSLEKRNGIGSHNSQNERNFKNIRSQQKYRAVREEVVLSSVGDQSQQRHSRMAQQQRVLRRRQAQWMKKVRVQEERSGELNYEMGNLEDEIDEARQRLESNGQAIVQLNGILGDNQMYVLEMGEKKVAYEQQALQFREIYNRTEVEIETARTSRDRPTLEYQKKLQIGIQELTRMRDMLARNIEDLSRDIVELTNQISHVREIDTQFGAKIS